MTPEQREQARCTARWFPGMPDADRVAMFFPRKNEPIDPRARTACHHCPVKHACRTEAVVNRLPGFWGGTTGKQRAKERRTGPTSTALLASEYLYAHRGEWFATRDLAEIVGRTRNTTQTALASLRDRGQVEYRKVNGGRQGSHGEWRVPAMEATG